MDIAEMGRARSRRFKRFWTIETNARASSSGCGPHRYSWRIVIGEKNLKEGLLEIKERKTGSVEKVRVEEVVDRIARKLVIEG
jgi:histidyl-tRNA synthetase